MPTLIIPMTGTDLPKAFKAPVGKMYKIHTIYTDVLNDGGNQVVVLTKLLTRQVTIIDAFISSDAVIYSCEPDTNQYSFMHYVEPEIAKFITVANRNTSAFDVIVYINYTLFTASRMDLIWEWFKRGAN